MREQVLCPLTDVYFGETRYRTADPFPPKETLSRYPENLLLDGKSRHYWFYVNIAPQLKAAGKRLCFSLNTVAGLMIGCDCEPQCAVFLNGQMAQSLDVNHQKLPLAFDTEYEIYLHLLRAFRQKDQGSTSLRRAD